MAIPTPTSCLARRELSCPCNATKSPTLGFSARCRSGGEVKWVSGAGSLLLLPLCIVFIYCKLLKDSHRYRIGVTFEIDGSRF